MSTAVGGNGGGPGILFTVVGPSGAGKDSIINHARRTFKDDPSILFVRRLITRPADGATEDHSGTSETEFLRLQASGALCVSWQAHGLRYGLPAPALDHVNQGGVAIANGSRKALGAIFDVFPAVQVVEIRASVETISKRLKQRGREDEATIAGRLARSIDAYPGSQEAVIIDNNEELAVAGNAFVSLVRSAVVSR